jgi:hypothetical protein
VDGRDEPGHDEKLDLHRQLQPATSRESFTRAIADENIA